MNLTHRAFWLIFFWLISGSFLLGGLIQPTPAVKAETSGLYAIYLPVARNRFPLQTHFGVEMNPISDSQGLAKMADAGTSWVRRNGILWSNIEPVEGGGYDWSSLTALEVEFLRARANNLNVIAIVRGVPEWARVPPSQYACGPIAPSSLPAFGNFMYALVQRYSGSPYFVKHWEIWNEPDVDPGALPVGDLPFGCMGNVNDSNYYGGQYYATVLQAAYPMIKAANSEAQVIVGGLLLDCNPLLNPQGCIPARYLEGILVAGGKDYFDGVSFHAYDFFSNGGANYPNGIYGNPGWYSGGFHNTMYGPLKPALVAKAQYIKYLFGLYNVQGKFLINTETALLCGGAFDPPGGPGCEADANSSFEKLKAAYVPQTYAAALAEGLLANIWYTPRGWRNSGLLYDNLNARPAYEAYQIAYETLKDAKFMREIHDFDGDLVFGYEFKVGQKFVWLLWTLDGYDHSVTLTQSPAAVWDELGSTVVVNANLLTIQGLKTYYVDWGP